MTNRSPEERDRAWDAFRETVDRIGREVKEARSTSAPVPATTSGKPIANASRPRDKTQLKGSPESIRARSVARQLLDLKLERGVLKKDIAAYLGVSPSYLSQLIARSLPLERLQQIADAAGVSPQYFDEYVAKIAAKHLLQDASLLNIVRRYLFEMTPVEKTEFYSRNAEET